VVLDVEGWENFGDEDLLRICRSKMFFLEYLSIRNTRVSKLPPEINELCRLQVLDASKTQVTEIPFGVFVATRLDRLDLRGTPIRQLTVPKQILELQSSLHELLLGGETATRLPHDILRFSSLHTLATVDLSQQPASFVKALGDLRYLGVLAITWSFHQSSDRNYCEALRSSIKRWNWLKSLTIHCGLGCSMEFLGSLSDPPRYLEKFKVTLGRFVGVPQWFHGLRRLSFVQIIVCKQGARDLEILRDLPKLKCLILGLDFIPREAIVIGNEGFHELQRFSIDCPVPWLTFESRAMPKLTYLQLEFHACPTSPISVPSGIKNLSSLTEVALWYNVRYANSSSVKMTVEAVREEVANRRNMTQMISLFINGIEQDDAQEVDEETESTTGAPSGPDAGAEGEAVVEKTTAVVDTEITEAES
jgi:Leucine-rich repeat (LRR) protein